ncbi:MAG: class I SAM-dependent methyltransferase [Deltaproteobacteria bacterium]|nr:class I SAM-dependent methyltransferase [Deltaproteobacteria bacterium]
MLRFRPLERELVEGNPGARILDLGCGAGEAISRLASYGARVFGVDPHAERVREAATLAPAVLGCGERLPWRDECFDLVYVSHVFHHASDLDAMLREIDRVLAPGGLLFAIESVDDSPLMRLARRIQPRWDGDAVLERFRYAELLEHVQQHGFEVRAGETFNWLYFVWEMLPLAFRPADVLTGAFVNLELALRRSLDRFGGHCWLVAEKKGPPRFSLEPLRTFSTSSRLPAGHSTPLERPRDLTG